MIKDKSSAFLLRKQAWSMFWLLIGQFFLGIATNLFISFPQTTKPSLLWQFARSQILIVLHMIIGLGLLIGTFYLLVRARHFQDNTWQISAVISSLAVVLAFSGGILYISSQLEFYSFLMATGFIIALLAYAWGLYQTK
ncbi:hypothetical protein M1563_02985 [Patescibacteria group bacterium]|nr:hypothetical protein [Patescibacteria group bacterium]MCL5409820.1 hypothetical protein [Patescibacteria group bacterium]